MKIQFNKENLNDIPKMIIGGIDMWGNMLATQQLLDKKVGQVHGVDVYSPNLWDERIMALRDEVMEYAKTTKCFKYWSLKEEDPFLVRLEEFSDGIHFYLQQFLILGVTTQDILQAMDRVDYHMGMNVKHDRSKEEKRKLLNTLLNMAMHYLNNPDYPVERAKKEMIISFQYFARAGRVDGFTDEYIEKGYYLKNRINQERLKSGY